MRNEKEPDREKRLREHPIRQAILDLLNGEREMTAIEIRDELPEDPPLGVVLYHLRVLCKEGLLRRRAKGRTKTYRIRGS